jgi:DNA-binding NarL/FixJ family response regulator
LVTAVDFSALMDDEKIQHNHQLLQEWSALKAENEALARRLAILQSQRSTLGYTSPEDAKMSLEERIEWLTEALLTHQKRPNGDRAKQICRLQATILARYEAGESLKAIADELALGYETVKTYLKRSRASLRLQVVMS